MDELKKELYKSFAIKYLVHAKRTLDMRITHFRYERKIYLSHKKYTECVLKRFNIKNSKPISTPLAGHMKLTKKMFNTAREEKENMSKVPYTSVVKSLIGVVSRFLDNLGKEHWEAVKWILRGSYVMTVKVAYVYCTTTTEAEYIMDTEADKDMIWLKRFLQNLGLNRMDYIVYCDN
uniref:Reverse transcriptase Ty1/copia-type domain-containing protein n=1 Tax=Solanum lycopersicum TaxID=4081 RepID=A0A3Q7FFF5_SOLLC